MRMMMTDEFKTIEGLKQSLDSFNPMPSSVGNTQLGFASTGTRRIFKRKERVTYHKMPISILAYFGDQVTS